MSGNAKRFPVTGAPFFQIGVQTNSVSNCYTRRRKVTIYPPFEKEERKTKLIYTIHKTEGFLQNNITKPSKSANLDEACRTLFYGSLFLFVFK